MKSRTSCFSTSRKYSATVRPLSPTRRRAPGGSFICPKHSAVESSTPDSFISSPEVVALTRPLAHAAEDGTPAVLHGDVVDELHDDDGLSNAGTPEQARLTSLYVRSQQVDDLDARLEDFGLGLEFGGTPRGLPVDGPTLHLALLRGDRAHARRPAPPAR